MPGNSVPGLHHTGGVGLLKRNEWVTTTSASERFIDEPVVVEAKSGPEAAERHDDSQVSVI